MAPMARLEGHFLMRRVVIGLLFCMIGIAADLMWQASAFAEIRGTTGLLEIDVPIPDASLRLDGQPLGLARGFRRELPPGDYQIEVSAPGYKTTTLWVHVVAGGSQRLQLSLAPTATFRGIPSAILGPSPDQTDIGRTHAPVPPRFGSGHHRSSNLAAPRPKPRPPTAQRVPARPAIGRAPPVLTTARAPPSLTGVAAASSPVVAAASTAPIIEGQSRPAPTVPYEPPTAPVPAVPSPLDKALEELIAGNVAFNTPRHMQLGRSRVIQAKLFPNIAPDILIAQLTEAGRRESAGFLVADRMSATLYDGGAFDISPSGPQQQFISHQQVTTWTWAVTPKQVGRHDLILSFDAVIRVADKDGTRTVNTFKHPIKIEIPWPETFAEWLEWFKKTFENLSWLWVTILLPVGLWIWNRYRMRGPRPEASFIDDGSSQKA
jgi:hypothetical protein